MRNSLASLWSLSAAPRLEQRCLDIGDVKNTSVWCSSRNQQQFLWSCSPLPTNDAYTRTYSESFAELLAASCACLCSQLYNGCSPSLLECSDLIITRRDNKANSPNRQTFSKPNQIWNRKVWRVILDLSEKKIAYAVSTNHEYPAGP